MPRTGSRVRDGFRRGLRGAGFRVSTTGSGFFEDVSFAGVLGAFLLVWLVDIAQRVSLTSGTPSFSLSGMTEMSSYQEAVVRFATEGQGNAVVQAVAGSGKTTTLKMVAQAVYGRIQVVAFNKPVANELASKMPSNAHCSTLHSVGNRAWSGGRKVEISGDKTKRIVRYLQEDRGEIPRWFPSRKVAKVVSLAKNEGLVPEGVENMTGLVPDTRDQWEALLDHYGVETDDRVTPDLLISAARKVLLKGIEYGRRIVDFDDMLYLPTLTEGSVFSRTPWVFVDELQDFSGLQREMVIRMVSSGGRFLGVGDRHQAIYGWRGADVNSMNVIRSKTNSVELPLSICYRCPTKVLDIARTFVPSIEAAPGALPGIVEAPDTFKLADVKPGHLVVCRNRAPGITLAYRLLGAGVPVRVLGASVGQGIVSLIESFNKEWVEEMLEALSIRTMLAIARAKKREDDEGAEEAIDQDATIRAVAEGLPSVEKTADLVRHVTSLFGLPEDGKVLVGTIHSVKGLEADEVWFLDRDLIPSRGAKQEWQKEQEKNLFYVGVTRARRALRFVKSSGLS